MTPDCTIEGAEYLAGEMSADELCRKFEQRLQQELGAKSDGPQLRDILVAIAVEKRGSLKAKVTAQSNGKAVDYPVVGFDVMDRSLKQSDLDLLAEATAKFISSQ